MRSEGQGFRRGREELIERVLGRGAVVEFLEMPGVRLAALVGQGVAMPIGDAVADFNLSPCPRPMRLGLGEGNTASVVFKMKGDPSPKIRIPRFGRQQMRWDRLLAAIYYHSAVPNVLDRNEPVFQRRNRSP